MKDLYRRRPVLVISLSLYAAYCILTVLGLFWYEPLLMPAVFSWPYPFLLAVQRFVPDPAGWLEWLAALALAFVPIGAAARLFERMLAAGPRLIGLAPLLGALAIVAPLASLTVLGYAAAIAFGWPMGE